MRAKAVMAMRVSNRAGLQVRTTRAPAHRTETPLRDALSRQAVFSPAGLVANLKSRYVLTQRGE